MFTRQRQHSVTGAAGPGGPGAPPNGAAPNGQQPGNGGQQQFYGHPHQQLPSQQQQFNNYAAMPQQQQQFQYNQQQQIPQQQHSLGAQAVHIQRQSSFTGLPPVRRTSTLQFDMAALIGDEKGQLADNQSDSAQPPNNDQQQQQQQGGEQQFLISIARQI